MYDPIEIRQGHRQGFGRACGGDGGRWQLPGEDAERRLSQIAPPLLR